MGRHLSPRYDQVIQVTGYAVLTAVNWSKHWCPICVHYQFSCAPKLAKKYEIEHCSRSSKTINWSADSFQINHVTSMSWHMSPRYGHVILVSGYPVLTAVKPYCECPVTIKDVDLPRHAWDTAPFLLTVSPTPPIQSVDACVRSVNHVTTKRKEADQVGRLAAPLWFLSKFNRSMGLYQNVE